MRKWRLVQRKKDGKIRDSGLKFWTRRGATRVANRLNKSDSAIMLLMRALGGTSFFVIRVDEIEFLSK